MAVSRLPRAIVEVLAYGLHHATHDGGGHSSESRGRIARDRVEDPLWVSPERQEHPVAGVAWNRNCLHPRSSSEPTRERLDARKDSPIQFGYLGQVLGHEPHGATDVRIACEDDHWTRCNAT